MSTRKPKKKTTEFGNVWDTPSPPDTHERIGNSWFAWLAWAMTLEKAEVALGQCAAHTNLPRGVVMMPMLLAVRAMLLGYALECWFKALYLTKGNDLVVDGKYKGVPGGNNHDLLKLAQATGFVPTSAEAVVLQRISKFVRFAGRYPVAKTPAEMKPDDDLTEGDVGFFSKKEFRIAESLLKKLSTAVTGKKDRPFPRKYRTSIEVTYLYIDEAEALAKRAKQKRASKSEVIRQAVCAYLSREEMQDRKQAAVEEIQSRLQVAAEARQRREE